MPGVYEVKLGGTLEPLDTYTLMLGQTAFHYEVRPGDSTDKVLTGSPIRSTRRPSTARSLR